MQFVQENIKKTNDTAEMQEEYIVVEEYLSPDKRTPQFNANTGESITERTFDIETERKLLAVTAGSPRMPRLPFMDSNSNFGSIQEEVPTLDIEQRVSNMPV